MSKLIADISVEKYNFESGEPTRFDDVVAVEHSLALSVFGEVQIEFACTPEDLEPLVVGWLYTSGLISGIGDIEKITLSGDLSAAEVLLRVGQGNRRSPVPLPPGDCDMTAVRSLIEAFYEKDELFALTGSVHGCLLASGGRLRCRTRDIGRHNAIDKAVGKALLEGLRLSECLMFTSGRVPREIAEKAVMAGIPALIARSAPTQRGLEFAHRYGLKLMGFSTPRQCNIYT